MDDLVKRLRDKNCCDASHCNCDEAADRIEALEAALNNLSLGACLHADTVLQYINETLAAEKKNED